ncbi:Hypothetical predicted protein [Octopus vulgaris]|uniref:Uncharacterized protein n=1 Tax=Octopus vulgaris TaxID=6645 RepID=A0AA36B710_OCTVU|nr:Hypothetical predicted protein [Octopus vulgaris]
MRLSFLSLMGTVHCESRDKISFAGRLNYSSYDQNVKRTLNVCNRTAVAVSTVDAAVAGGGACSGHLAKECDCEDDVGAINWNTDTYVQH